MRSPLGLKLGEVLVDILVAFAGGESVLEGTGVLLAAGYGLILAMRRTKTLDETGRT